MSSSNRSGSGAGCFSLILLIILVPILLVGDEIIGLPFQQTVTGTVTGTQVAGGNTYINFEVDGGSAEVFRNSAVILMGKFDSRDVTAALQNAEGQRFELRVYGWRIPMLGWYRNIIDYRPLDE